MLIPVNILQISYAAQTFKLDDKITYSHFLRTSPSNSRGATDLVNILKHLKETKATENGGVYLIYTDSEYGQSGAQVRLNIYIQD